ncbi:MAG: phenylalanine--tRNA ligase subunit beta, partial [Clostridia bacterium]|nr:phenylalanine--tRNA ligase subunit beta [Clostridia bacterium]
LGASEEKENGILRRSMMQCLMPFVYKNRSYKDEFGMFEIGRTVHGTKEDGSADEHRTLGVILYSKSTSEKALYLRAVDMVNTIVSELKHVAVSYSKIEPEHVWQHPKNTASIVASGVRIGTINTLHPTTLSKIAKNAYVVCIEIDMDDFDSVAYTNLEFEEPTKFPTIDYDLSLVVPEGVRFDDISKCWDKKTNPELMKVSVIDIYDSESTKSITIRLSFGLETRTLTGEEVQKRIDVILEKLGQMNIVLRG